MCTSTLAQSFYNRHVLPLVSALLSTKVTNFEGSCSVGEVQLLQAEIPKDLQVTTLFQAQSFYSQCHPVTFCFLFLAD
jgi:hypothetical protein